jgi:hypothetical protein
MEATKSASRYLLGKLSLNAATTLMVPSTFVELRHELGAARQTSSLCAGLRNAHDRCGIPIYTPNSCSAARERNQLV